MWKKRISFLFALVIALSVIPVEVFAAPNASRDMGSVAKVFMGASPYGANSSAQALGPGTARHYESGDGVKITIYTYDGADEGPDMKYDNIKQVGVPIIYSKQPGFRGNGYVGTYIKYQGNTIKADDKAKAIKGMGYSEYIRYKETEIDGETMTVAEAMDHYEEEYENKRDKIVKNAMDTISHVNENSSDVDKIIIHAEQKISDARDDCDEKIEKLNDEYRSQYNKLSAANNYIYENTVVGQAAEVWSRYGDTTINTEGPLQKLRDNRGDPAIVSSSVEPGDGYKKVSDSQYTQYVKHINVIPGGSWTTGSGDTRTLRDDFMDIANGVSGTSMNNAILHMTKALQRDDKDDLMIAFYNDACDMATKLHEPCMSQAEFEDATKRIAVVEPVHAVDIVTNGIENAMGSGKQYVVKSRLLLSARECTAFWKAGHTGWGTLGVVAIQQDMVSACNIYPTGAFGLADHYTYTAADESSVANNSWPGDVGIGVFTLGRVANPDSVWESPPALNINVFNKVAQDAGTNDYRLDVDSINNPIYKDSLTVSIPQEDWQRIYGTLMYAKTDKKKIEELKNTPGFIMIPDEDIVNWIDDKTNKKWLQAALRKIKKVDKDDIWKQDKTVEWQNFERNDDDSNGYTADKNNGDQGYMEKYKQLWEKIMNSSVVKGKTVKIDVPTKNVLSTDLIDTINGGETTVRYGSKYIKIGALTPTINPAKNSQGQTIVDTNKVNQQNKTAGQVGAFKGLNNYYPYTMYNVNYINTLGNAQDWLGRAAKWKDIEGQFAVQKVEVRLPDLEYSAQNLGTILNTEKGSSTAFIDAFQKNKYNANTQMFGISKDTGYEPVQDLTNSTTQLEIPYDELLAAPYGSNVNFYVELDQPKALTVDVIVREKTQAYTEAYEESVMNKHATFDPAQVIKADTKVLGAKKYFDLPESYDFSETLEDRVGKEISDKITANYLTTYRIETTQSMTIEDVVNQTGANYEIANQILEYIDSSAEESRTADMKQDYADMTAKKGPLDNTTRQPNAVIYITLWTETSPEAGGDNAGKKAKEKVEQWQMNENIHDTVESTWDVAAVVPVLRDSKSKELKLDQSWYTPPVTRISLNGTTWIEGLFGRFVTTGQFDKGSNPLTVRLNVNQFQNPLQFASKETDLTINLFPMYDKHTRSSMLLLNSPNFKNPFTDPGSKITIPFTGDNAMDINAVVHRAALDDQAPELAAYMSNSSYIANNNAYKNLMNLYTPVPSDADYAKEKVPYVEKYSGSKVDATNTLYQKEEDAVVDSSKVNSNVVLSYGWDDIETFDLASNSGTSGVNGLYTATKKWNRAVNEVQDVMRVTQSDFSKMKSTKPTEPTKAGNNAWIYMPITKLELGVDVVKPYAGKEITGDTSMVSDKSGMAEEGSRSYYVFDGQEFKFDPTYKMSYTGTAGVTAGQPNKDGGRSVWVLGNKERTLKSKDALVVDWKSSIKINANWSRDYDDNVSSNKGIPTLKSGDQYKFNSSNSTATITGYVHIQDPDFVEESQRSEVIADNTSRKNAMKSVLQNYANQLSQKNTFGTLSNVKGGYSKSMESIAALLSPNTSEISKTMHNLTFDLPSSVPVTESEPLRLAGNLGTQVGGSYYNAEYGLDFNSALKKSLEGESDSWYIEDYEGIQVVKFQVVVDIPSISSSYQTINSKESDFLTARSASAGANASVIKSKIGSDRSDPSKIFAGNCYSLATALKLAPIANSYYSTEPMVMFGSRVDFHIRGSVYDNT